jgi:hypothetical protein
MIATEALPFRDTRGRAARQLHVGAINRRQPCRPAQPGWTLHPETVNLPVRRTSSWRSFEWLPGEPAGWKGRLWRKRNRGRPDIRISSDSSAGPQSPENG